MQKRVKKKKATSIVRFVVLGGGVAAVACAQQLAKLSSTQSQAFCSEITLISASMLLKETFVSRAVTEHLDEIEVHENEVSLFQTLNPTIRVVIGTVSQVDTTRKQVLLHDGVELVYDKLCVCTGSVPHLISNHPQVIGIRDIDSISDLVGRLQTARRIAVVGNGGIALELIHNLPFCDFEWIIRDSNLGSTFFDEYSSRFLVPSIYTRMKKESTNCSSGSFPCISAASSSSSAILAQSFKTFSNRGAALGPDWLKAGGLLENLPTDITQEIGFIQIHANQEVVEILEEGGAGDDSLLLTVITSRGERIRCDFVISATGVTSVPCVSFAGPEFAKHEADGALVVDKSLLTSVPDVYAAGDCSHVEGLTRAENSSHWFQMKLWTQARQLGLYAGHKMYQSAEHSSSSTTVEDSEMQNFFFELFTHATRFLGHKVVFLGRFNGQGLGSEIVDIIEQHRLQSPVASSLPSSSSRELEDGIYRFLVTKGGLVRVPSSGSVANTYPDATGVELWFRVRLQEDFVKLVLLNGLLIGVTCDEIDRVVHEATVSRGAYPSPLNYMRFPKSVCTSVNEVICHGIPDMRPLQDGDIVNIDVSVYYKGYHADLNETFFVGTPSADSVRLVKCAYETLAAAVAICKPGTLYKDVGEAIGVVAKAAKCSVVTTYCGHGIGRLFHTAPNIPHYPVNKAKGTMKPGHVFTIEPMINLGYSKDVLWPDDWTAVTKDGSRSSQFEHTMVVTETGVELLTARVGDPTDRMIWNQSTFQR